MLWKGFIFVDPFPDVCCSQQFRAAWSQPEPEDLGLPSGEQHARLAEGPSFPSGSCEGAAPTASWKSRPLWLLGVVGCCWFGGWLLMAIGCYEFLGLLLLHGVGEAEHLCHPHLGKRLPQCSYIGFIMACLHGGYAG